MPSFCAHHSMRRCMSRFSARRGVMYRQPMPTRSRATSRSKTGRRAASVLPEPVGEMIRTSCPARIWGIAACCGAVGPSTPNSRRRVRTKAGYFKSDAQEAETVGSRLVLVVVALVRVRGALALLVEGLPAAARGPVVRVRNEEPGASHRFAVVHRG